MSKSNKTFCGGSPTWANACVGNNGSPGYWEYSKGFSSAANLLIDTVLGDTGRNLSVDEFIYPVCFNMRHSVELRLKAAIADLRTIANIRGGEILFDYTGSHDIGLIWDFYKDESESIDERYKLVNERIISTVGDIAEVDATGQTFRYPVNAESQKHLTDVSLINFLNLKHQFDELEKNLDTLHRLNIFLIKEYSLKTFTKKLSRKQLFDIANTLPPKRTWSDDHFDETRGDVKRKYGISSSELSKAINLIKENYEFSYLIDMQPPLVGVTLEGVMNFLEKWTRLHEIHSDTDGITIDGNGVGFDELLTSLVHDEDIRAEIWREESQGITPEILAGISALYYFARELDFSERYVQIYDLDKKEADHDFKAGNDEVRNSYFHILDKTNALHNILQSLYFIKHIDFAEQVVEKYSLEAKFSWLESARSGALFLKPDYSGYGI